MKIFPLGESALTIDFGNEISVELNQKVLQLAYFFEKNPFPGMIEVFPAYSSLTVFYDVLQVRAGFLRYETAFDAVRAEVEKVLAEATEFVEDSRMFEIPISFDDAYALDLDFIASYCGLTAEEVIEIFLSKTYRVFMVGFLPGFAYMGEVDERIAVPRLEKPRAKVQRGSVGIAGKQTGIYPIDSPGGWRIIGKTEVTTFNMNYQKNPSLLKAGDLVKFYRV